MKHRRVKVWDLPTRLFHWLLAICVSAALITGQIGGNAIDWHGRIGVAIVGLLVFRLAWGVLGPHHARFASFMPTPARIAAHLRGQWRGVGHNPLGALSVFALLLLIGVQLGSGLFGNDDIAFHGPLFNLVAKELSDRLTGIHELTSNAVIALIALHLGAIVFYLHVKKNNLVKPMITGWKDLAADADDPQDHASTRGGGPLALIVALLVALAAVYGASGVWLAAPPAPPVQAPAAW